MGQCCMHIVFECTAIDCNIAICDYVEVGKKTFHVKIWVIVVKKRIYVCITIYSTVHG